MNDLCLSPEEVHKITRRKRYRAQIRVLTQLGIQCTTHPEDGSPIVLAAHAEAALGGRPAPKDEEVVWGKVP